MCRHLGYLGRPRRLSELLLDAPHSLEVQSYAPKEMRGALLNADGFGVAWYPEGEDEPARYRSMLPLWNDENFPGFAKRLRAGALVANARSATPGLGMGLANTPPYVHGPWTFSHNGYIRGFAEIVRPLRASLSDEAYALIRGNTDSEHLFALFVDALSNRARSNGALSNSPVQALRSMVQTIATFAEDRESLLSIVVSDGKGLWALRHALHGEAPTLYRREREGDIWIASEAMDDEGWVSIAPGSIVAVSERGVSIEGVAAS